MRLHRGSVAEKINLVRFVLSEPAEKATNLNLSLWNSDFPSQDGLPS
jgi:hypothetical protein